MSNQRFLGNLRKLPRTGVSAKPNFANVCGLLMQAASTRCKIHVIVVEVLPHLLISLHSHAVVFRFPQKYIGIGVLAQPQTSRVVSSVAGNPPPHEPQTILRKTSGKSSGNSGSFFDFFLKIGFVLSEAEGIRRFPWSSFYEILPFPPKGSGDSPTRLERFPGKFPGNRF